MSVGSWAIAVLRAARNSRTFVMSSVVRELRMRYLNSWLGALWIVLNPLIQVVLYAFIFSNILSARIGGVESENSYTIYLLSGFCFWFNFLETFARSTNIFMEFGPIMKKNSVPKVAFPSIVLVMSLINSTIFTAIVVVLFLFFGHPLAPSAIYIFPLMLSVSLISIAAGVIIAQLSLIFYDLRLIVPIILQFSFWSAPIVYTIDILPPRIRLLVEHNPLTFVVRMYQSIFVYQTSPGLLNLSILIVSALALLALAGVLYLRAKAEIVDML